MDMNPSTQIYDICNDVILFNPLHVSVIRYYLQVLQTSQKLN
jgi:hypothetical protein